jgi:uncharacterized protein YdhG (YjbR/CyaY superfamily)
MQTQAKDVTSYLLEADEKRRESLTRLRALCLEVLTGYEECMGNAGPYYQINGQVEVGFANQVQYISLYILKEGVVNKYRPALAGLSVGKGCIRYTSPKKMDMEVIRKMLVDTVLSPEKPC